MSKQNQRLIAMMLACWTCALTMIMVIDPPNAMAFNMARSLLAFLPGAIASLWLVVVLSW